MLKKLALLIYSYNVELCLMIQRSCKKKFGKLFAFVCVSPIIIINTILRIIGERTIGKFIVYKIKAVEKMQEFVDNLAIVAIAKNEGDYIEEWIAYYKTVGVNRVYLYENNGTDNMREKIQSYIDNGFVVYHNFPGEAKQLPAYNHAIQKYGHKTRYMAMVDCDEFLVPTKDKFNLFAAVSEVFASSHHSGGIGVNWCVFGSGGKIEKEPGLLMERFQMRAKDDAWNNKLIKTIVDPRLVKKFVSPHFAIFRFGSWCVDTKGKRVGTWYIDDVDFSVLRCNHYFCKSVQEFKSKQARGLADRVGVKYDMTKFKKYDVNDCKDESMNIYASHVRRAIEGGKEK